MKDSAKENNQPFQYISTQQHPLLVLFSYSLSLDDGEEWIEPYDSDEYDS